MGRVYLKDELLFGDEILSVVKAEFQNRTKNLKSGIPITRSNGVKEWTVLASIVLVRESISDADEKHEIKVLTMTTGVKLIPELKLHHSQGMILHDLHAEVLSLRALNWLIMLELSKIHQRRNSLTFKDDIDSLGLMLLTEDSKLQPGIKLAMYISELPCGDLSMELINGGESWKRDHEGGLLRGRLNYNQVGIVRTKPGRSDSMISLSKSCSDKLCSRQCYGLGNAMVASILPDVDIKLDWLVLPRGKIHEESVQRCFCDRMNNDNDCVVKILPTELEFKFDKQDQKMKSSDLSLVIIHSSEQEGGKSWISEVIGKNGLKNGRSKANLINSSMLCNANLVNTYREVLNSNNTGNRYYSDFKKTNTKREEQKRKIRNEILRNEWIKNYKDDFCIMNDDDEKDNLKMRLKQPE